MRKRILYLPVEIAARELDSRLLIALFAAERGIEVLCGQKWLMQSNARQMPPGFWIFKTLTPGDRKQMKRVRKLNSLVGAIDEEMPGLSGGEGQLRWIENQAMDYCDFVFCQGQQHFEMMAKQFPNMTSNLTVTGNPRFDVLRKDMGTLLRENAVQYGVPEKPFILINTNFGFVNSAKRTTEGHVRALKKDGRMKSTDKKDMQYLENIIAFETANFKAIKAVTRQLSKTFPDYQIIFRPHPGEITESYHESFSELKNVQVSRDGPVAYWLNNCAAMIHTNCTTATEAFALGKTPILYQTTDSPINDEFLSSSFSIVANSEGEVIERVGEVLSGQIDLSKDVVLQRMLEHYFAARTQELAAERIANVVEEKLRSIPTAFAAQSSWRPGIFFRKMRHSSPYQLNMFPDFTILHIQNRLKQLAKAASLTRVPNVRKCADGIFHIFPTSMEIRTKSWSDHLPFRLWKKSSVSNL